jgi:hypothetical protein
LDGIGLPCWKLSLRSCMEISGDAKGKAAYGALPG